MRHLLDLLTVLAHGDPFLGWDLLADPQTELARLGVATADPRPVVLVAPLDGVLVPIPAIDRLPPAYAALRSHAQRAVALLAQAPRLGPERVAARAARLDVRPIVVGANPIAGCEDDLMFSLPGERAWEWSLHLGRSVRDRCLAVQPSLEGVALAPTVRVEAVDRVCSVLRQGARVMRIAGPAASRVLGAIERAQAPPRDLPARTALARLAGRGAVVAPPGRRPDGVRAWSLAGVTPTRAEEAIEGCRLAVVGARRAPFAECLARALAPYQLRVSRSVHAATHVVVDADAGGAERHARQILLLGKPWIMLARSSAGTAVFWGSPARRTDPCPACVMARLAQGPIGPALAFGLPRRAEHEGLDPAVAALVAACVGGALAPAQVALVARDPHACALRDFAERRLDCPVCASHSTRSPGERSRVILQVLRSAPGAVPPFPPDALDDAYLTLLASAGPLAKACQAIDSVPFGFDRDEALVARAQVRVRGVAHTGVGRHRRDALWRAFAAAATDAARARACEVEEVEGLELLGHEPCRLSLRRDLAARTAVIESAHRVDAALLRGLLSSYAAYARRRGIPFAPCMGASGDPWAYALTEAAAHRGALIEQHAARACEGVALSRVRDVRGGLETWAAGLSACSAAHDAMAAHLARSASLAWARVPGPMPAIPGPGAPAAVPGSHVGDTVRVLRGLGAQRIAVADLSAPGGVFASIAVVIEWRSPR